MPHSKGPHKKCPRVPETKMKWQCYKDALILTVAKYAISLKQWRRREEYSMIYLFVSSSSGKFSPSKREA
jgi:hypothetical protein